MGRQSSTSSRYSAKALANVDESARLWGAHSRFVPEADIVPENRTHYEAKTLNLAPGQECPVA